MKNLTRKEINRLRPGTWVAWVKGILTDISNDPNEPCFVHENRWTESQVADWPSRTSQRINIWHNGERREISKNHIYLVKPVVEPEAMHEILEYNN